MRSRSTANEQVAEVARRRLELLSAELAGARRDGPGRLPDGGPAEEPAGPGEPFPGSGPGSLSGSGPSPAGPGRHALRSVGASESVGGWVHDRLPPTLQGRVQIGASHLTVVALLVAAALAATSWFVLRAGGSATVVHARRPTPAAGSPTALVPVATAGAASAAETPTASPSGVIVVDVAGKVRHPGIVTLPLGSRVVDAIESAGGARAGVGLRALNLARVLVDGEQILVGVPAVAGVAAPAASLPGASPSIAMVNVNTADQTELETLPGIGPVTATAILKSRTDNGPFTSVDQLLDVSGIGDATLADIAPFVTI